MALGLFITLEGGEGGGKSTQVKRLLEKLDALGTREPGGTPEADKIRTLMVDRNGGDWSPIAETLLAFAARDMHVRDVILPALEKGRHVVCDRFTDSTRAYQGYAGGADLQAIEAIKQASIGALEPDLTFILDLPVETGLARAGKRQAVTASTEDRFENKGASFHEKLRQGFLDIARKNPQRCHVIDATQDVAGVHDAIWSIVKDRL